MSDVFGFSPRNNTGVTNVSWDIAHRPMRRVRFKSTSRYLGVTRTTGIPQLSVPQQPKGDDPLVS
jgi:hypothetical protein